MKIGITRFPGTNCDMDVWKAVEGTGHTPLWLWHQDHFDIKSVDRIVVPGGFSFGDYLRSGALAARSPVMRSVREAAEKGTPVLGICNGFQILTEAELLPGSLLTNESCRFVDRWVSLEVQNTSQWKLPLKSKLKLPVAHGTGRFYAKEDELKRLEDSGQVWLTYTEINPNGSLKNIAGVTNAKKNVAALMPHPERAMYQWMGSTDGRAFFVEQI
jgi:phosphoribosylformylglycinamidine synthase I